MEILELLPRLYDPGLSILVQAENLSIVVPGRNCVPSTGRKTLSLVDKLPAFGVEGSQPPPVEERIQLTLIQQG